MSHQSELNNDERELETALQSLRPAPVQFDPVTAALMAERRAARRRVRVWQAAAAVALVSAGGAWIALGPRGADRTPVNQKLPSSARRLTSLTNRASEPPTVATYRRALAQSTAALDALLDAQAITGGGQGFETMPVSVFVYGNPNLPASLGEM